MPEANQAEQGGRAGRIQSMKKPNPGGLGFLLRLKSMLLKLK
jgi:hypothetical protein